MRDFVDIFRTAAEVKEWKFFYGSKGYQNFEVSQADITGNDIILILFPASITATIESGAWSRYRLTSKVFLARKFESETFSSIAETEIQKYERRLKELTTELDDFLYSLFNCHEGMQAFSIRYFHELNQLSASVDGCGADITFEIW